MTLTPMNKEEREFLDSHFINSTAGSIVALLRFYATSIGEFHKELAYRSISFLIKTPDCPEANLGYFLAFSWLGAKYREESINSYLSYMKTVSPTVLRAEDLCLLAQTLLKEYRYDEANHFYLMAISIEPLNSVLRNKYSEYFIKSNQLDVGIEYYKKLHKSDYCLIKPFALFDGSLHKDKNGKVVMDTSKLRETEAYINILAELKERNYVYRPKLKKL